MEKQSWELEFDARFSNDHNETIRLLRDVSYEEIKSFIRKTIAQEVEAALKEADDNHSCVG